MQRYALYNLLPIPLCLPLYHFLQNREMEDILNFICVHSHYAHWIIFGLLMLAGLNIPISEDVLILTGGALAATCILEHTSRMFIWIYIGSWTSAWEAYWIGRKFGPKLYTMPWVRRFFYPERIEKLHYYYEKFGVFTFIVGRFCPGGVRNALFMSAGLGKMPFVKFILRDAIGAAISVSTLFFIGFTFGANYEMILHYVLTYDKVALGVILLAITATILYFWQKNYRKLI